MRAGDAGGTPLRTRTGAVLLWALCALWAAIPQTVNAGSAAGGEDCRVCSADPGWKSLVSSSWADSDGEKGHTACWVAQFVACDEGGSAATGDCWLEKITGMLVEAMQSVVVVFSQAVGEHLMVLFVAVVMLAWLIQSGRAFIMQAGWNDVIMRLVMIGVVMGLATWLMKGGSIQIWQITGTVASAGLEVGLHIRETASAQAAASAGGGNAAAVSEALACSPISASGEVGWARVQEGMGELMREMLDVAAIIIGTGVSFLPDLKTLFKGFISLVLDTLHLQFKQWIELVRLLITYLLVKGGIGIIIGYAVVLVEAVVIAGLSIALLPVTIWLALFRSTRDSLVYCVGSLIYVMVVLMAAGVTVMIARLSVGIGMRIAVRMIENDQYWIDSGRNPEAYGCLSQTQLLSKPFDMYGDFEHHLCLMMVPEWNGMYASAISMTGGNGVTMWLPSFIALFASAAVAGAVLGYTQTVAGELSGHSRSAGAAQAVMSAAASVVGKK